MTLYLVRHAKASNRERWEGDDTLRPLTDSGFRQARRFADRFDGLHVPLVLSSPALRCVQTVTPLATAKGLSVTSTTLLLESSSFTNVIDLLLNVADGTVLCSHGDVIPDTISALERRGMDVVGAADWRKGATWLLERRGDCVASASTWAPPPSD